MSNGDTDGGATGVRQHIREFLLVFIIGLQCVSECVVFGTVCMIVFKLHVAAEFGIYYSFFVIIVILGFGKSFFSVDFLVFVV